MNWKMLCLLAIFHLPVFANNYFEQANAAYKAHNYENAITLYQKSLQPGTESPEVYYNLGNCYYRIGKIGKAIVYFEKAALLAPSDEDIAHNLAVVKQHTVDKLEVAPKLFIFSWFDSFTALFSSSGWMKLLIIWAFLLSITGIVYYYYNNLRIRRYLALTIMSIVPVMLLTAVFLYARYHYEQDQNFAVITQISAAIKNAPSATANDAFVVHEGLKLRIEDAVDDWVKIRLEDGKVGWANKSDLEII